MISNAITRVGDRTTGHGSFPPRPTRSQSNGGGSPNVYANDLAVNRTSDQWEHHPPPAGPHNPSVFDRETLEMAIGFDVTVAQKVQKLLGLP